MSTASATVILPASRALRTPETNARALTGAFARVPRFFSL